MREHSPEMRAAAKRGAAAWPPAPRRFDSASRYLDSATVFGVKPGLVRDVVPDAGGPGVLVEHNIVLRRL